METNKFNVLGFPRSGNHWISYILNYFYDQHITDQSIFKNHHIFPVDDKPLIYIVRNPRECIIRHFGIETILSQPTIPYFLSSNINKDGYRPSLFLQNLKLFNEKSQPKLLVYLEELLENPKDEIQRIADFIGGSKEKVDQFIENYDYYKQDSINWYTSTERTPKGDQSMSKGKDLTYHSKKLSEQQIKEFDYFFKSSSPELYEKYLKRYKI